MTEEEMLKKDGFIIVQSEKIWDDDQNFTDPDAEDNEVTILTSKEVK